MMTVSLALTTVLLFTAGVPAATITWTGTAGDGDYTNPANWTPRLPRNDNWTDTVVFGASATAGTVHLHKYPPPWGGSPRSPSIAQVRFETPGWTIRDTYADFDNIDVIRSVAPGVGTNTLDTRFNADSNNTWTINAGNTLVLAQSFYQRNKNIDLVGGGTLHVMGKIGGFGSSGWGLHVQDATLIIDASDPYTFATGGAVYLEAAGAQLHLETDEQGFNNLIGSEIFIADGLQLEFTQVDGRTAGIAQDIPVTPVPEPVTAALAVVSGTVLVLRRRRA
jgi:hypothetical protein